MNVQLTRARSPASTVGACTVNEAHTIIAESLNRADKETTRIATVLENIAGQGNVVGSRFEDLRNLRALTELVRFLIITSNLSKLSNLSSLTLRVLTHIQTTRLKDMHLLPQAKDILHQAMVRLNNLHTHSLDII